MLTCPQCKKKLAGLPRRCQTCQTDLSLLADYAEHLRGGLERAEALTRAGELGQAVLAYLEVLEVDPDNATARRQVGQVAAAVRHFDHTAESRRWQRRMGRQARARRALASWAGDEGDGSGWFGTLLWALLVVAALAAGYGLGYYQGSRQPPVIDVPAPQDTP
jgi:hypothetical protein